MEYKLFFFAQKLLEYFTNNSKELASNALN